MLLSAQERDDFVLFIWDFYKKNKRMFAWRQTYDPYAIVVSEIMLQQTQTHRVALKYEQFIQTFPNFYSLASSSLRDVLSVWQGLGYNRRGQYLYQIAVKICNEYNNILPDDPNILIKFPGIGAATASSICAFAFNKPTVFIETNIRTVFIHSFFNNRTDIHDKELFPLIAATVDQNNPREWYYALMDYGVFLKKSGVNPSKKSKHYTKQSKFEGSDRQIRGAIIRYLIEYKKLSIIDFELLLPSDSERVNRILDRLIEDGLLVNCEGFISII